MGISRVIPLDFPLTVTANWTSFGAVPMSKKYQPKPKPVEMCPVCHQLFIMKRTDHRYCSDACRQTAHRSKPGVPRTAAEFIALTRQYNELAEEFRRIAAESCRREKASAIRNRSEPDMQENRPGPDLRLIDEA